MNVGTAKLLGWDLQDWSIAAAFHPGYPPTLEGALALRGEFLAEHSEYPKETEVFWQRYGQSILPDRRWATRMLSIAIAEVTS